MANEAVDDGKIASQLLASLPAHPLSGDEWGVIENIEWASETAPVGFYPHNGVVTHFVVQYAGASRVIGWNPLRVQWEVIAFIDPGPDDAEDQRTVRTIDARDGDGDVVVEFDLDDDFSDSVMDFIERYAQFTFQNEIEPTLPSEIDAAANRQELIDAAEGE